VTGATGGVLLAQTFDPYGSAYARALDAEWTGDTRFGFTGEYTDADGLLFLRARYYNPLVGRFFQRDTWEGDNQQPQSINLYMYVEGNVINWVDPSGHVACSPIPIQNSDDIPSGRDLETDIPSWCRKCPMRYRIGTEWNNPVWTNLAFDPAIDVPLAPELETYKPFIQGRIDSNSCGVVSLSMVLQLAYGKITAQEVYNTANSRIHIVGGKGEGKGMSAWEMRYVIETFYSDYFGAYYRYVTRDVLQHALRNALQKGNFPFMLVKVDSSHGNLIPHDNRGTAHWILATGLSAEWERGTPWQWVRLNNPFDNQVEYYPWETFEDSFVEESTGNMVYVYRRRPPRDAVDW
jgi:RHS repeat-associated protein